MQTPFDSDRTVSRRKYIIGAATLAGGVGVFTLTSQRTKAQVSMDTLSVSGDSATMDQPPSSVALDVSGSWQIDGTPPEQSRVVLQVEHASTSRDMDEIIEMDTPASGVYQLHAQLLDHPEITGADLMPEKVGGKRETEIVVRVILLAVSGGEVQAETFVEDTATITMTKDGLELSVGGAGEVSVSG